MSTRGAYGFRIDGEDKVTYNHSDSYPEGLGEGILNWLKTMSVDKLLEIAKGIKMVGNRKPTKKQIDLIKTKFPEAVNTCVGNREEKDWYCLLRNFQGDLEPYANGLPFMEDGQSFLTESLFCEHAYIINLDDNVLEYYVGFNKDENADGRYASKCGDKESGCGDKPFMGVALVGVFDLDSEGEKAITGDTAEMVNRMHEMSKTFKSRNVKVY